MHEEWLDQALRRAESPLADAGFTLRVMRALPQAPRARSAERADWILLGGTALGSAVVAAQFPLGPVINLLVQSAQVTWLGGALMLACMAGALIADYLRRV
jgi:anti-sigma factor RsiW